ncbi:MAG: AMP-binding protein [Clostridiales Family XIII bacterium]|nr:AMP-binding protein [Clostridiales Family XIII bacterium]
MRRNILEYLEDISETYRDCAAFSDETESLTFGALRARARAVGSGLLQCGRNGAIAVFMERGPSMIAAFFGVVYSGNYYIPLEKEMSQSRISAILDGAAPAFMICDEKTEALAKELDYAGRVLSIGELMASKTDEEGLSRVSARALDVDPVYVVFTSGSTGLPKGVVACHRNVIDYAEALGAVLRPDARSVFGMQVPLYVDACLKEICCGLKYGAKTVFIPKKLFMTPIRLVEFLNRHGVNTVCWVVSALTLISGTGTLEKAVPRLHTIAFGSEVFPSKQFALWRKALPKARWINLYGPTECTGMSCYYEVPDDFDADMPIPIGKAFQNSEVFLIDDGVLVNEAERPGELYIRGAGVTLGYFNGFEKTREAFVQNPAHANYPEIVYRTGDIAKYDERGELVYIGRRDNQIKHMGYRIELAEIEAAAAKLDAVEEACCVFLEERDRIALCYAGSVSEKTVASGMRKLLPRYMEPAIYLRIAVLPRTNNGKLDRAAVRGLVAERPV